MAFLPHWFDSSNLAEDDEKSLFKASEKMYIAIDHPPLKVEDYLKEREELQKLKEK